MLTLGLKSRTIVGATGRAVARTIVQQTVQRRLASFRRAPWGGFLFELAFDV